MRVVIDTNVVISRYLTPQGVAAQVLDHWKHGRFVLIVSDPILTEYQKVLSYDRIRSRHQLNEVEIAEVIGDFREFATLVEPTEHLAVVKDDPDDDKFLECAVAGEAEIIVSGDPHLLALKQYRGIQILSPAAFLAFLNSQ
jgi:putative PIN family toxin of toxin-antitoxin system